MSPRSLSVVACLVASLCDHSVNAQALSKPTDGRVHLQRGVAYHDAALLQAAGSNGPYTFSFDAATLPPGLTVNAAGAVSGITCAAADEFALGAVSVKDSAGALESDDTLVLALDPPPPGGCALTFAHRWPKPVIGQPYQATLLAEGGRSPYTYAVVAGNLPAGLALSSEGVLSGTPTATASQRVTVALRDAGGATGAHTVVMNVTALTVAPAGLNAGTAGIAYSQTLSAEGAAPPYAYSVSAGSLPAGLTLSSAGRLTGTPMAPGTASFTITARGSDGAVAARSYTLTVARASQAPGTAPTALPGMAAPVQNVVGVANPGAPLAAPASIPAPAAQRPDPAADPGVAGAQSSEAEALKRLGGAQMRNVLERLDSDNLDCRPEWEQRIHLNAEWRDARPSGLVEQTAPSVDRPGCGRGASLWAAGTVDYGRVPGSGLAAGSRFSTPGLSAGVDLVPLTGVRSGIALGHGRDRSEVGAGLGRLDARADSISAYGSWLAPLRVRLDATLGQSRTLFDAQRVAAGDALLSSQRRVTQRFGALAGSTRVELGGWRMSPRVGVEYVSASLDAYAENDASPLALGYDAARLASSDLHGGLALTRQWRPASWSLEPELSVDWHKRLQGNVTQTMRYLDDSAGSGFALTSSDPSTQYALLGVGMRMRAPQGWSLSLGARSALDGGALRSTGYTAAMQWPF